MIELIMVVLIVSALAVFVLPKLVDVSLFRLASYADRIQNATAFANRLALAQRDGLLPVAETASAANPHAEGAAKNAANSLSSALASQTEWYSLSNRRAN